MTRGGPRPGAGRPETKPKEKLTHTIRLNDTEKDFILFARSKNINLAKIKKSLLTLLILFLLCMPAFSQTLTGGIEYTVDNARIVAFDNSPMQIAKDEFKQYLNDPRFFSNTDFIKGAISEVVARKVVPFYEKGRLSFYGVQYDIDKNKKYYYATNGRLLKIDICDNVGQYPYKAVSYNAQGKLITVHLAVSDTESFLFDRNKKLIGHWIDNQFYDSKGKKGITRRL